MKIEKIAILGGGNLGLSIAKGFLKLNEFKKENVIISEIRTVRVEALKKSGFNVLENNNLKAIEGADLVIVSVKPQQITEVLTGIKSAIDSHKQILISTVTGVTTGELEKLAGKIGIVRIMPNTAIEINQSMTCITCRNISNKQEQEILTLFNRLGKAIIINEDLMGAATVIGACGIAFALRFMRAMSQGGIEIGFSADISQLITAQTIEGAAQLILESGNHPEKEIDKVTTPMGVTISGLNEMEHQGFSSSVIKGLLTSYNKLDQVKTNKKN
ncbi:MAG: pyrroline-5-carboxylate reductase [Bacteroidales bacterium]|nr:pyrroline-5-carboxylate reductase [Bacteroidales bacterium]MBN2818043.1 pyrroline-5-carboxylate reductase [Bacteroidales bacterium]